MTCDLQPQSGTVLFLTAASTRYSTMPIPILWATPIPPENHKSRARKCSGKEIKRTQQTVTAYIKKIKKNVKATTCDTPASHPEAPP